MTRLCSTKLKTGTEQEAVKGNVFGLTSTAEGVDRVASSPRVRRNGDVPDPSFELPPDEAEIHLGSITADWTLPEWVRHPRIEGVLGCRLSELTWAHATRLVDARRPEDLSLEFKSQMYVLDRAIAKDVMPGGDHDAVSTKQSKDRQELAKDVAAMANAGGGLVVVGVQETDEHASALQPVHLRGTLRTAIVDVVRRATAPFISGIAVGYLRSPEDPSHGLVLIYVPASADAPHAVVEPNSHRYSWFIRDEAQAIPLSEAQIAVAYRDRFAGRADIERRLATVFNQGCEELEREGQVWLAVAAVPRQGGPRRALDRHRLDEVKRQTTTQQMKLPGAMLGSHASFGRERIVLRDTGPERQTARDHLLHLYTDGRAFAGVHLDYGASHSQPLERRRDLPGSTLCIRVGDIASWAIRLLGIVSGHVTDAGGAGDLEICCGLIAAIEVDPDLFGPAGTLPTLTHVVVEPSDPSGSFERIVPGTVDRSKMSTAEFSASPIIASDFRELIAIAAQATNEIIAEFGQLPSDPILTSDGQVIVQNCHGHRLSPLVGWATAAGLATA
jgi:hypothetical protein